MSVILIRPVCPEGKLPSTDWDYPAYTDFASWDDWDTADIVDAWLLISNWLVILDHVNGNLNGSDLAEGVAAISETTYVLDEEVQGDYWPTTHQRHSHDGYDSAFLAANVITAALMGSLGYGALRHPASSEYALLMHGALIVDYISVMGIAVPPPYDWYYWHPAGNGYLYEATDGNFRMVGNAVISDFLSWSTDQQRQLFAGASLRYATGDDITSLYLYTHTGSTSVTGWEFSWVILALV
jgi:hypothetical protein